MTGRLVTAVVTLVGAAVGSAVWATRGRRLGATARRGPRTGAIEVDPHLVDDLVDKMLATFVPCGPIGHGRQPAAPTQRWIARVDVRDAATGQPEPVTVYLKPEARAWNDPPVTGVVHARATGGRVFSQEATIKPAFDLCQHPDGWRRVLRETTAHELSHASDPGRLLEIRRKSIEMFNTDGADDSRYAKYVNSEVEIVANLTAVADELRAVGYDLSDAKPIELLQLHSRRWRNLEPYLTPANRQRFLRLAARAGDVRRAQDDENRRRAEANWRRRQLVTHVQRLRRARHARR